MGVDHQKYFCERKHKCSLNCQAVCDVNGRFFDISMTYGGSSSNCLAFENGYLKNSLTVVYFQQTWCYLERMHVSILHIW